MSNTFRRGVRVSIASFAALLLLAIAPGVRAGETHPVHKNAVVQIVRDPDGNALRFGPRANTMQSFNWSGYVLPKFETKTKYTSASATWVVPSVSFIAAPAGFSDELSSTWVGIGGYCKNARCRTGDRTLIQLGTEQDAFLDGAPEYFAWYEILPAAETVIPSLPVLPGDTITASLSCAGKCKGKALWTLTMTDLTSGAPPFTTSIKYKSSKLSVEWIQEATTLGRVIQPVADYNTVAFSGATANGATANVGAGDLIQLVNTFKNNVGWPTSNPSAPVLPTLDGFAACWGADGILEPCAAP